MIVFASSACRSWQRPAGQCLRTRFTVYDSSLRPHRTMSRKTLLRLPGQALGLAHDPHCRCHKTSRGLAFLNTSVLNGFTVFCSRISVTEQGYLLVQLGTFSSVAVGNRRCYTAESSPVWSHQSNNIVETDDRSIHYDNLM